MAPTALKARAIEFLALAEAGRIAELGDVGPPEPEDIVNEHGMY